MLSVENPNVHEKDRTEDATLTLLDLPVEVFLHICSFLDSTTLVHGLGSACRQFYEILCDDSLWKVRIGQIWQNARYPVLPPDEEDELFWKQSCIAIERHVSYWTNENSLTEETFNEGHCSTVDAIMIMNKGQLLISGGRDRSLACWDLSVSDEDGMRWVMKAMAHEGWIWDLTAVDDEIYSCSWDKTVKSWETRDLFLRPVRTFEMNVAGALLCVTSYPGSDVLATGSHCRTVILFDPRAHRAEIARHRTHQGAVFKLVMNDRYVLSASEDKTVAVWDQRAGRIMKTIEISKRSYPMSIIMEKGSVHVGDSSGNLHLLNARKNFEIVKSYASGHNKGIKCLCSSPGGLITGSLDKTVRLLSPTDPPQLITSLTGSVDEIAGMAYSNNVLVITGSQFQIWRPKTALKMEDLHII